MCCKKPGLKIPNTPPPTLWKSSIHAGSAHITCRKTVRIHLGKSACAMETRGIETERGEQNRLINRLNLEIQISRTELRNSGLTEPARRVPGNGEMTCYLLLHNRNGEYTLWGNELEKYRTRIFESVDLIRDRSGYICDRSEIGQHPPLQRIYSSATFEQLLTQVCQTWPQHTRNLRQPKTWPESFCLGEDRQPAMPSLAARKVDFTQGRLPPTLMPVMSSVDRETRQLQLLLVMGVDDSLGGVVRLNGTLYPAFAVPSADNSQLVISALTDKGLRYAGYGVAVNHDADSHISPAPELMEFHLKTREAPLFAVVNTPEKQPDHLFRSLGFNRTWDEWRREEDARTHATERRPDRGWSQGM